MTINDVEAKKKEQDNKAKGRNKILKLYIIPIVSIIIFLAIIFFVDLDKIKSVFSSLDQLSVNNDEITKLGTELTQLEALSLNSEKIKDNLSIVNDIAANTDTQLIAFRDKVSSLVEGNNLTIISQKLSETPLTADQAQNQQGVSGNINLIELPFIFEIAGDFGDIKSFISELNTIDDFTIVKEMELSSLTGESTVGEWSLKITLVKYQFITSDKLATLYTNVPSTAKISDKMQEYIDLRQ
jgi:Tfp pilus assembly protein PilO